MDKLSENVINHNKLRIIVDIKIKNNRLFFIFSNSAMVMFDDLQICCEERYMHTDDDLSYYIGACFLDAEVREGPIEEKEYTDKMSKFLIITTSKGQLTVVNYNEHNGYYGGFDIVIRPTYLL